MGAIKRMLPDNWFDIQEEEITSIYVTAAGFATTMTITSTGYVTDSFGHSIKKEKIGSIKEMIERMIMNGFAVEIKTEKEETA